MMSPATMTPIEPSRSLTTSKYAPRSALGAALLFGASTPLAKLAVSSASPVLIAGLLYLGSASDSPSCANPHHHRRSAGRDSSCGKRPAVAGRSHPHRWCRRAGSFADGLAKNPSQRRLPAAQSRSCRDCSYCMGRFSRKRGQTRRRGIRVHQPGEPHALTSRLTAQPQESLPVQESANNSWNSKAESVMGTTLTADDRQVVLAQRIVQAEILFCGRQGNQSRLLAALKTALRGMGLYAVRTMTP